MPLLNSTIERNMKTILVATDFSKEANNAIQYAIKLAIESKASLLLFHTVLVPALPAELSLSLSVNDILDKELKRLSKIAKRLSAKYGEQVNVQCACRTGFAADEICAYAKENSIDLVVMGMKGKSQLVEKFIGSTTSSVLKKSGIPVLIIDRRVRYKTIKKIVLACDYTALKNKRIIQPMLEFCELFKSHVYVLNVVKEVETEPTVSTTVAGIRLNRLLENVSHSFHYALGEDVVNAVNSYVKKMKIELIVFIPHLHSLLQGILHPSVTQHMSFHTKKPLLILPEID